jgi:hypothetical protein
MHFKERKTLKEIAREFNTEHMAVVAAFAKTGYKVEHRSRVRRTPEENERRARAMGSVSDDVVRAIRKETRFYSQVAHLYPGVNQGMFTDIRNRRNYKHVRDIGEPTPPIKMTGRKGDDHPQSRAVITPAGRFGSIHLAAKYYKTSLSQIVRLCGREKGWGFADTDQHLTNQKITPAKEKPVVTPAGRFPSQTAAAKHHGITVQAVAARIKRKMPGWNHAN